MDADQHTVGLVILGGGLGAIGWLLSYLITNVGKKVDALSVSLAQHGERIATVEAKLEGQELRLVDLSRVSRVKP